MIKRSFDRDTLDIETDAVNGVVSGSILTLVVSLLRSSVIEGVMQSASFSTHGGYVGGVARVPSHRARETRKPRTKVLGGIGALASYR